MHELGIAEGILAVVTDIAAERPVSRVVVRIGDEQRIVADSLEFGFQLLAEGTVCADARLQCVPVAGDTIMVDEVEIGGEPPIVIRRPGAEVVEPPHHPALHGHDHAHDAEPASVGSTTTHGGS
jgi:hypothetical protein